MMAYFFIVLFELIGIGFSVSQTIEALDKKYPDFNKRQIFAVFWDEDWNTILRSALVLVLNLAVHAVLDIYVTHVFDIVWFGIPYIVWSFAIALILGWAGQRLIYKWLGTAENALDKKVQDRLQ